MGRTQIAGAGFLRRLVHVKPSLPVKCSGFYKSDLTRSPPGEGNYVNSSSHDSWIPHGLVSRGSRGPRDSFRWIFVTSFFFFPFR